ncbi:MAG: toprim domain-containing protein, partial [Gemmatimonadetes bacterium]|nr:toprim domain-containing protein [Gemmatimonadota bacterium]
NGTPYDRFRSRIQFPIQDPSGRIVGFGGRIFGDGEPKYLNSPETSLFKKSDSLYGIHQARRDLRDESVGILVEGYTDVISLFQSGIRNVVAPLGTALTPGHVRLLRNYSDRIVLLFDGDEAGMRATLRSLEVVMAGGLTPLVASLPGGQDPDDLLRAEGVDAVRTRITNAETIVPFVLEHPFAGGREEALRTLVRLLAASRDEIRLSLFVQEAARKSGIREEIFHKEIDRARGRETKAQVAKVVHAPKIRRRLIDAQRGIAYLGLENPNLIPVIRRVVKPDEVHDVPARKLLRALFECHDNGEQPTSSLLTLQGVDEAFSQIGVENEEIEDPLHILQDYIACIHEEEIEVAVKDLNEQIRDAEERNDTEALMELLKKRTQVSAKKKKIAYAYRVHSRAEETASGERSESTL